MAQSSPQVMVFFTTCTDGEQAMLIAKSLVDEQLAACVNILPGVRSVYRWQGKVNIDSEVLLLGKTTASCVPMLKDRVRALHTYTCPELLVLNVVDGMQAYLDWVQACCCLSPATATNAPPH